MTSASTHGSTVAPPPPASAGAPAPAPPAPPGPDDAFLERVFPDAPKGEAHERVVQVQALLAAATQGAVVDRLASYDELAPLLPESLAGMTSAAKQPEDGPMQIGKTQVRALSRSYASGEREAFVRVVDAGKAPTYRMQVIEELGRVGQISQGFAHGRFVRGYPALVSYFPSTQSSRLVSVVGNRYLVEVRVSHARAALDAQTIFEAMAIAKLAPPDEATHDTAPGR